MGDNLLYTAIYMHNSIETYRKSKEKNYLASIEKVGALWCKLVNYGVKHF
jgi:hypothetical protein